MLFLKKQGEKGEESVCMRGERGWSYQGGGRGGLRGGGGGEGGERFEVGVPLLFVVRMRVLEGGEGGGGGC